jgi:hypothetical protein
MIEKISSTGYVLLDLYNLGNITCYQIKPGAVYEIRDYTVRVQQDQRKTWKVLETAGLF